MRAFSPNYKNTMQDAEKQAENGKKLEIREKTCRLSGRYCLKARRTVSVRTGSASGGIGAKRVFYHFQEF
jgi:hypothetical protein